MTRGTSDGQLDGRVDRRPRSRQQLQAAVEAVLVAAPDPVPFTVLQEALDVEPRRLHQALADLASCYRQPGRGLLLQRVAGGYRIVTRSTYAHAVERILTPQRRRLSRAALETLAIVAYEQPVTQAQVDAVRGVDSHATLWRLRELELVRVIGRRDAPGRPHLYGTTTIFLEAFGLDSLAALPPLALGLMSREARETASTDGD